MWSSRSKSARLGKHSNVLASSGLRAWRDWDDWDHEQWRLKGAMERMLTLEVPDLFQCFFVPGLPLDMSLMLFFIFYSHHAPRRKNCTSCLSSLQPTSYTFWRSISAQRVYQMRREGSPQPCGPVLAASGEGCSAHWVPNLWSSASLPSTGTSNLILWRAIEYII